MAAMNLVDLLFMFCCVSLSYNYI